MRAIGRRVFVRRSAMALLAMGVPPAFLTRPLLARTASPARRKTLVCIFQRGAVDGLSMVVPFGERAYYDRRSSIAIPAPSRLGDDADSAIDLDGFFGLHPSLRPLHDLYRSNEMAIVHAVGSPDPTRSHFDAQDFMESGTPGVKSTADGWLNRVLSETRGAGADPGEEACVACRGRTLADGARHAADHAVGQAGMSGGGPAALRGISLTSGLPRSLAGEHPALALPDVRRFRLVGQDEVLSRLYRTPTGDAVSGAADEAFAAMEILEAVDPDRYRPRDGVEYPAGTFGTSLRQIAQLIKADVGVEVAFADVGGWDTHVAQGATRGQLARNLDQLSRGIRALHDDLGDRMEDVLILTMSEFGRTVAENGSGGTDHGHANCILAVGGPVGGSGILGRWPGLDPDQLYEGRDLAVTTDFRDAFAEVAAHHLGVPDPSAVFPGYDVDPARFPGIVG